VETTNQLVAVKEIEVDGSIISYKVTAKKDYVPDTAIILIHGALANKTSLDLLVQSLYDQDDSLQYVQFDNPGHGDSTGEPLTTAEDISDVLSKAIRELRLKGILPEKLILVGHSYGGCIAIDLVAEGLAVDKLILCQVAADWSELTNSLGSLSEELLPEGFLNLMEAEIAGIKESLVAEKVKALVPLMGVSAQACGADISGLEMFEPTELIGRIKIPTLVIGSEKDTSATPESVKDIADGIEGSSLTILEGSTHTAVICEASRVAEEIIQYLR
jgi:pimeloyl-ACP methyl ester carboxylesterase